MSYDAAVADFIGAMEMEGLRPTEPLAQRLSGGELIRFHTDGDGQGRKNAWAILYLDERPAGAFGNYRTGLKRKWKAGDDRVLTEAERTKLQAEWRDAKERRERERQASREEAELDAVEMWRSARPAEDFHPYLSKKRMSPAGLRQSGSHLLVPMVDGEGLIRNIQRIGPDGTKRFLKGGRTDGLFWLTGAVSDRLCIGEGIATMAAVHAATGIASVAAFSAKNISAVARIWWSARPDLDITICADDDDHLDRNIGIEAATAAAEEIGARLAIPMREAA